MCSLGPGARRADGSVADAGGIPRDSRRHHRSREALSTVEPLKIQYFAYKGTPRYWFADPYLCHCVYAGNEDNYLRFRQLKREHAEILDEETAQQKYLEFETLPANQAFYGE